MLKLNYGDDGLYLERASVSVEALVSQRAILALRTGRSLYLEPSQASILLPLAAADLQALAQQLQGNQSDRITLSHLDKPWVELVLVGTWIAANSQTQAGMFITTLGSDLERNIEHLWQHYQTRQSGSLRPSHSPMWGMARNL